MDIKLKELLFVILRTFSPLQRCHPRNLTKIPVKSGIRRKATLMCHIRNGLIRHLAVDIEILLMKNADDLINGIPVDQQTVKAGLGKGSGNFLMTLVDVSR